MQGAPEQEVQGAPEQEVQGAPEQEEQMVAVVQESDTVGETAGEAAPVEDAPPAVDGGEAQSELVQSENRQD